MFLSPFGLRLCHYGSLITVFYGMQAAGSNPAVSPTDQVRQFKEFLLTYNKLSDQCFAGCINDFSNRKVTSKENDCAIYCLQKYLKSTARIGQRFQEYHLQENEALVAQAGFLHIGGLRTALYNYMFAKQNNGKLFLRIEDTDQSRLVAGAVNNLISILKWAGIHFDKFNKVDNYVIQSERLSIYKRYADILLNNGSAYRCFCSKRRLSILKKSQQALKEFPRYDNKCRYLTENEIDNNIGNKIPFVVRLKLPESTVSFTDMLHGETFADFRTHLESDPVLLKSEGYPTYHLANVVDDHLMDISHVFRGVEWLHSTSKHVVLYDALNWKPPTFAHLPLLMNLNGTKLSKRQGDVFVEEYKNKGFSPASILNFVCMGSGFQNINLPLYGDESSSPESVTEELSKVFSLEKILNSPSVLDFSRLNEFSTKINTHICASEAGLNDVINKLWFEIRKQSKVSFLEEMSQLERNEYLKRICTLRIKHVSVLPDLVNEYNFLWHRPQIMQTNFSQAKQVIEIAIRVLNNNETMREMVKKLSKEIKMLRDVKFSDAMKFLRICLTGKEVGPSVGEVMEVLGKEETTYRLNSVINCSKTLKS